MPVFQLDDDLWFPDPRLGEESGLVAVGGDLSVARLLLAYSNGFFPWFSFQHQKEPLWYCPLQRFVIFPNEVHISHSMRQLINRNHYKLTINQDFEGVIKGCATVGNRNHEEGAWLGPDIINAYTELYRQHFAASVEVWEDDRLVGGLYGVILGLSLDFSQASSHPSVSCNPDGTCPTGAFFGESMFSQVPNASKLALIHLARMLVLHGGQLIDCQFETPHLRSMGGRHITYDEYMRILRPLTKSVKLC